MVYTTKQWELAHSKPNENFERVYGLERNKCILANPGKSSKPNNSGGNHETWYDGDLRYSRDTDAQGNSYNEHYSVNGQKNHGRDPFNPLYDNTINGGFGDIFGDNS